MQIKRFEAKNMTDALRQIKRELGPEAVILSAKDRRRENRLLGISRKIGVEVTAAIDEDFPGVTNNPGTPSKIRRSGDHQLDTIASRDPRSPSGGYVNKINDIVSLREKKTPGNTTQGPTDLSDLSGFERHAPRSTASLGSEKTPPKPPDDSSHLPINQYLIGNGLSTARLDMDDTTVNYIALVGNPGVGKTTTIAKLAAHYQLIHKQTVGLLSLDHKKIGGLGQLQTYADSMGLPLETPEKESDLTEALTRLSHCRVVLVDTPAHNPVDTEWQTYLQTRFKAMTAINTLLVVSAENREEDLKALSNRHAPLAPTGIIISKLDLTRSYTDVVNFLCQRALPVFFLSSGPRVPFDLIPATMDQLAERLIQNRKPALNLRESEASQQENVGEGGRVYLANKNSDIFHRPECKWIRLINQSNIVEFSSFADALNNRFKPCRYCNPQHLSITGMLTQEGVAL